ncbi:MAG: MmcQ/YjbR family DNA-binding protein [Clostridiales bacterium]|nr:MmcQ/YjbR family DNA-binding protein [Clostridiales bacterium]
MNYILERIFKHYKPNFAKLQKFGFVMSDGAYIYDTAIMNGGFALNVKITSSDINTEVLDLATGDPYTLFLVEGAGGGFVGAVRTDYENVMLGIAEKCFDKYIFKSDYAQKLIQYVYDTYDDTLEFLWDKFPDNAIWRRKDNQKWYGALLTVTKDKLGLPSDEKVEIIDLRAAAEDIDAIVDGKKFFRGYHMNKKHWITVCLDGSVPLDEIQKMLDVSYDLARK